MKQHQFVSAYKVLQKLEQKELPLDISYKFFKLKQSLSEQWEFQLEREKAIIDKYKPVFNETQLDFESEEAQAGFTKEISELADMDVFTDENKVKIDFNNRIELSISDIEALDPFVQF